MKTKKQVLASFMRRNKDARETMASNAGFESAAKFKAHLLRAVKKEDAKKEKEAIDEIEDTPVSESTEEIQSKVDMIIAFDTTGSMASYIGAVRKRVAEMTTNLFKNTTDLRIGIVAFGDYCDMISKDKFGIAYQVLTPTTDENEIIQFEA
jgi:Mg-chelatase subunit ChlD